MILKYSFNLWSFLFVCFELRDTRILQSRTGKKVSIIEAEEEKKIPFSKCKFASDFSKFFAVLPLILDWQVSMVVGKQKTKQQQKILTVTNAESSKPRESTSPAAGATMGILGISPLFWRNVSFSGSFHLPRAANSYGGQ